MPHIAGFRGVLSDPSGTAERDPVRALYRYHQRFAGPGRTFERKNLIAAVALSPYADGVVRPHETSVAAERDAALASITRDREQVDPVLLGFRDPANEVDRLFRKVESGKPTLELTTPDDVVHRIWRVQDAELLGKLRHYFAPRKLHLLDGCDRYEAMLAFRDGIKAPLAQYSSANYALSCLVNLEDPTLATAPRHRILCGDLDVEKVVAAAATYFIVERLPGSARDLAKQFAALRDTVAHQPGFIVVFAGTADAYKMTLSPDVSAFSEGAAPHRALQKLDPVVVDGLLIGRAMPGVTMTTEVDVEKAIGALDDPRRASAIVVMRPLSVEQIAHVDEIGQLLPPHSTAFHPPIAGGLIKMPIDPDEDLV